jgi:hypothetical protein
MIVLPYPLRGVVLQSKGPGSHFSVKPNHSQPLPHKNAPKRSSILGFGHFIRQCANNTMPETALSMGCFKHHHVHRRTHTGPRIPAHIRSPMCARVCTLAWTYGANGRLRESAGRGSYFSATRASSSQFLLA